MDGQADRQTGRQADRQTDRQTKQTNTLLTNGVAAFLPLPLLSHGLSQSSELFDCNDSIETDRQTARQTDRQTDKTDKHTTY